MIALKLNGTKVVHTVFNTLLLYSLDGYIQVDSLPELENIEGCFSELHYKDGVLSYEYLPINEVEANVPIVIPDNITMRQAKLALLANDLLETVESAILNTDDVSLKIEWEYATILDRNNEVLILLCHSIGMNNQKIDEFFNYAKTL
jgi:hypothetical protein